MTPRVDQALRSRDRAMMGSPQQWPCYPFLPLTRPAGAGSLELGVLYDARGVSGTWGHSCTVFVANLLFLPPTQEELLKLPRHVYDTFDELLDAGWRVD